MRMFAWMMKAEEMPEPTKEGALKGIGIGTRVVTARARVIDHPEELASLRHGEVMVCRITSPEWSVALGRVAAIVTDEGALLSHPAVIAREYGVTAVVGCGLATRRIRTGERVRVDPIDGTVTVAS
jgi:pyruvate,water dikinase